jgi:hypothetical protein
MLHPCSSISAHSILYYKRCNGSEKQSLIFLYLAHSYGENLSRNDDPGVLGYWMKLEKLLDET